jgi:hypothetical protein
MKLYIFPKKDGKNKHFFHTDKNYLTEKGFSESDNTHSDENLVGHSECSPRQRSRSLIEYQRGYDVYSIFDHPV